jgi:transposase
LHYPQSIFGSDLVSYPWLFGSKNSLRAWVIFQSAHWVSFGSAPTRAITDALGNPLEFVLTGGQGSDIGQPETLLALTPAGADAFVGDKGYDADPLVQAIKERGMKPVIPPRSGRTQARECDWFVYKERHLIECFFNKIKHYRIIFSRYENEPVTTWDFYTSSQHSSGCGDTSTEPKRAKGKTRLPPMPSSQSRCQDPSQDLVS